MVEPCAPWPDVWCSPAAPVRPKLDQGGVGLLSNTQWKAAGCPDHTKTRGLRGGLQDTRTHTRLQTHTHSRSHSRTQTARCLLDLRDSDCRAGVPFTHTGTPRRKHPARKTTPNLTLWVVLPAQKGNFTPLVTSILRNVPGSLSLSPPHSPFSFMFLVFQHASASMQSCLSLSWPTECPLQKCLQGCSSLCPPLVAAVRLAQAESVEALLAAKAQPNAWDALGVSALSHAVEWASGGGGFDASYALLWEEGRGVSLRMGPFARPPQPTLLV